MFLNEVGKQMTASSSEQTSSQHRHKRKGKKKKHSTDDSNVLETSPPPPQGPVPPPTRRPSRQLEFNQAMEDFSHMFPHLDREVIESVLRSNNGAVDITIDQLLVLDEGTNSLEPPTLGTPNSNQIFPPSPFSEEQPPPFGEDRPPPYSPPSPNSPFSKFNSKLSLAPVTERPETHQVQRDVQDPFSLSTYPPPLPPRRKQYQPAMLGPLPDDFLRIPPPSPQPQNQSPQQQMVSSDLQDRFMENRRQQNSVRKNDKKSHHRLEDERIAILLQNEVFLDELRRNPDFISSLDRDYRSAVQSNQITNSELQGAVGGASGGGPTAGAIVDNEDVRNKLPHMGKSTKTKLSTIAKKFNKKKRKSSKVNLPEPNITPQSGPPQDTTTTPRRLNDNTKRRAEENTYASLSSSSPFGR